ncbi:MAG: YciI family protein [Rhodobacteraceae bacterium]|jgi:hypothetical protein|nr:YciI family protein [Paracoccaceae bacterium]
MLYSTLCYHDEAVTTAWSAEHDAAVIADLRKVQDRWAAKVGPVVRLMPTSAATTLRKTENLVIDGPFAETKEQLLGFYVVDVATLDEALAFARDLAAANPGGAYEVRPVMLYQPDGRGGADGGA